MSPLFPLGFLLHEKSFCSNWHAPFDSWDSALASKSLLTFQARLGPHNLTFYHPSFTTLCTLLGENILFLFCLFQQIVSPLNSEGLFSDTWMGSSLFYMLSEYLLSKCNSGAYLEPRSFGNLQRTFHFSSIQSLSRVRLLATP